MKKLLLLLALISLAFSAMGGPALAQSGGLSDSLMTAHVDDIDSDHSSEPKDVGEKAPPAHTGHHHHCLGEVAPMATTISELASAFLAAPIPSLLAVLTGRAEAPPTEPPLA